MKRLALSAIADIAVIVVFVAIGREEHNSGSSIVGLLETAAPFLIALAIGCSPPAPGRTRPGSAVGSASGW